MKQKKTYINFSDILARPSIFKMILSDRSDGKTTQIKNAIIDDVNSTGKIPLYMRRVITEISDETIAEFWRDLIGTPYESKIAGLKTDAQPVRDIRGKKIAYHLMTSTKESDKMRPACLLCTLSTAGALKSTLSYAKYKNIYIDEYIPIDDRYLSNEPRRILETYKTIDREHYENRVIIAGNKITRFNPIFQYWNITKWHNGINQIRKNFDLLVWSSKNNKEIAKNNPFDELTRGTEYNGYNAGEFLVSYDELIKKDHYKSAYMNIIHGGRVYAAFWAPESVVIAPVDKPFDNVPSVCVQACAPEFGRVIWLDSAPRMRDLLIYYKYQNRLYFSDEITLHALADFYKKI